MINRSNYKVLAIDDSPMNRLVIRKLLHTEGIEVLLAVSGNEGLSMARSESPDLILLDLNMPGLDGFEVCSQLKADQHTSRIPIIFLSAERDQAKVIKGFLHGAVDYITQPFHADELVSRVHTHLELKASRDIIDQQNQVLSEKNDALEKFQKDLTDNLAYAQIIQQAILPSEQQLLCMLHDHFILYLPKEQVSGDFYWFTRKEHKAMLVTADCTGHGTSGALLSMLGISFLMEIGQELTLPAPDRILENLRQKLIQALSQNKSYTPLREGMDMGICIFDAAQNRLEFAGAYLPLYRIRNNEVQVFKGNRLPVSVYYMNRQYTSIQLDVEPGDRYYMFSDGYMDQMKGKSFQRFMSKRLKTLLLEIHQFPMAKQKEILHQHFLDWKGDGLQIDDITSFGFQFISNLG